MNEDFMEKYRPRLSKSLLGAGIGMILASFTGPFIFPESDESARLLQYLTTQKFLILGTGLIGIKYLSELVAYMRGYANERLNILREQNDIGDLEQKTLE